MKAPSRPPAPQFTLRVTWPLGTGGRGTGITKWRTGDRALAETIAARFNKDFPGIEHLVVRFDPNAKGEIKL